MLRKDFSAELNNLTTAIQTQVRSSDGSMSWKTIAAFNVREIADSYAQYCIRHNPLRIYRIIQVDGEKADDYAGWCEAAQRRADAKEGFES